MSSIEGISFWQQDQNYWQEANTDSQSSAAETALINVIGNAEVTLSKGLSSIANGTALQRVNSQLVSEVQSLLQSSSGSSSLGPPSGSSTSSPSAATQSSASSNSSALSASASSGSSSPKPATGTGTVALTTDTMLSSLGILPGGTITISAGLNATTYTSTGSDTIGNLIDAINVDLPTNAQVTASLNAQGRLVITSRNDKDSIAIVGSGTDAAAIGFGTGNSAFQPPDPPKSSTATSGTSASASSTSGPSTAGASGSSTSGGSGSATGPSTSSSSGTAIPSLLALAEQNLSSAAGILSGAGVSGSLVDMLT